VYTCFLANLPKENWSPASKMMRFLFQLKIFDELIAIAISEDKRFDGNKKISFLLQGTFSRTTK